MGSVPSAETWMLVAPSRRLRTRGSPRTTRPARPRRLLPTAPERQPTAAAPTPGPGSFSQTITGTATGNDPSSFSAAQRDIFQATRRDFRLMVVGVLVGTFTPWHTGSPSLTTDPSTVSARMYTITFHGLDSVGGDHI